MDVMKSSCLLLAVAMFFNSAAYGEGNLRVYIADADSERFECAYWKVVIDEKAVTNEIFGKKYNLFQKWAKRYKWEEKKMIEMVIGFSKLKVETLEDAENKYAFVYSWDNASLENYLNVCLKEEKLLEKARDAMVDNNERILFDTMNTDLISMAEENGLGDWVGFISEGTLRDIWRCCVLREAGHQEKAGHLFIDGLKRLDKEGIGEYIGLYNRLKEMAWKGVEKGYFEKSNIENMDYQFRKVVSSDIKDLLEDWIDLRDRGLNVSGIFKARTAQLWRLVFGRGYAEAVEVLFIDGALKASMQDVIIASNLLEMKHSDVQGKIAEYHIRVPDRVFLLNAKAKEKSLKHQLRKKIYVYFLQRANTLAQGKVKKICELVGLANNSSYLVNRKSYGISNEDIAPLSGEIEFRPVRMLEIAEESEKEFERDVLEYLLNRIDCVTKLVVTDITNMNETWVVKRSNEYNLEKPVRELAIEPKDVMPLGEKLKTVKENKYRELILDAFSYVVQRWKEGGKQGTYEEAIDETAEFLLGNVKGITRQNRKAYIKREIIGRFVKDGDLVLDLNNCPESMRKFEAKDMIAEGMKAETEIEEKYIRGVLRKTYGNVEKASELLGIIPLTLYEKKKLFNIGKQGPILLINGLTIEEALEAKDMRSDMEFLIALLEEKFNQPPWKKLDDYLLKAIEKAQKQIEEVKPIEPEMQKNDPVEDKPVIIKDKPKKRTNEFSVDNLREFYLERIQGTGLDTNIQYPGMTGILNLNFVSYGVVSKYAMPIAKEIVEWEKDSECEKWDMKQFEKFCNQLKIKFQEFGTENNEKNEFKDVLIKRLQTERTLEAVFLVFNAGYKEENVLEYFDEKQNLVKEVIDSCIAMLREYGLRRIKVESSDELVKGEKIRFSNNRLLVNIDISGSSYSQKDKYEQTMKALREAFPNGLPDDSGIKKLFPKEYRSNKMVPIGI